jgi:Fe-S oxidoreductase
MTSEGTHATWSTQELDADRPDAAEYRELADDLRSRVADGWDVVFVEPSDAVMFQDEYLDLLGDASRAADGGSRAPVERVADSAYGVCEYLDAFRLDENLSIPDRSPGAAGAFSYHGHCNQKVTNKDHHTVGVLRRVSYDVDPLDTTCCGMAGSFGYHDEHYDLSQAIGSRLFEQVEDSPADRVVASGGSCRSQLGDRDDADDIPPHPIEAVAERLHGS